MWVRANRAEWCQNLGVQGIFQVEEKILKPEKVSQVCLSSSWLQNTFEKWASLVTQAVKNLSALWETQVQSLGQEDVLEKGMATHSSIPARRIPCTEEPGEQQSVGLQTVRYN